MNFDLKEAIEILERMPKSLEHFLYGVSDKWLQCNEGEGTWNVSEVIEHLIEGEKYNWLPRLETILQEGENKSFPPFDRYSHLNASLEKPMEQKLMEFYRIRQQNLTKLKTLMGEESLLESTGSHPAFGKVKARELISAWVVHDLTHMAQIIRVMAERYRTDVGPWVEYLGILNN